MEKSMPLNSLKYAEEWPKAVKKSPKGETDGILHTCLVQV